MLKKILHITAWVLVFAYMILALGFTKSKSKQVKCKAIEVNIENPEHFFIEKDDVAALFESKKIKPVGMNIQALNLETLEQILYTHPAVKNAEVYTGVNGVLKVDIVQRNPIMRIINKKNESYYIDEDGKPMPLSEKYSAHVLVFSGEIFQWYNKISNRNFSEPSGGSLKQDSILNDLFMLGKYIWKNELWRSQIEQVYLNENNEIEIIPRLGSHKILFGTVEEMDDKFFKLEALYKYGLNNVGWKKYKDINIKFKNQVICTKFE